MKTPSNRCALWAGLTCCERTQQEVGGGRGSTAAVYSEQKGCKRTVDLSVDKHMRMDNMSAVITEYLGSIVISFWVSLPISTWTIEPGI